MNATVMNINQWHVVKTIVTERGPKREGNQEKRKGL